MVVKESYKSLFAILYLLLEKHKIKLERLESNKHSSLDGPFINYDRKKSYKSLFFILYKLLEKHKNKLEKLESDKHSSFLGPIVNYGHKKVL
jgi:hypothetical protein